MSSELKLLGAVLLAGAALVAAHETAARPSPSVIAVVDRTFFCGRVAPSTVNVSANSGMDTAFFMGYLAVTSGPDTQRPLLYVRQHTYEGLSYWPTQSGVFARVGSPGCVGSRRTVPLTSAGLSGPPVLWGQTLKCRIRSGVLVRVRATMQANGAWLRVSSLYRGARGLVTKASLAVRNAQTGRPLAFVTIDPRSRPRVWSAPVCA